MMTAHRTDARSAIEDAIVRDILSAEGERPAALVTRRLTKRFGDNTAVDHLDLTVESGEVFGFLGPNGAGKTTTLRLILGLIYATSGEIEVLGRRMPQERREALRHIGGFVETPAFYPHLTARRNLRLLGRLNDIDDERRIEEVLDWVGLLQRADSKVRDYSHGMKQRLGIADALLHRPSLVILDEPTSGLDPQGMKGVRELITGLADGGTTVIVSSHLLHEVEQVCDRAVIINRGRLVAQGLVSELRPGSSKVKLLTTDQVRAQAVVAGMLGAEAAVVDGNQLVVESSEEQVREMVVRLVGEGIGVDAVVPAREQGLEDYFLGLTESSEMAGGAGQDTKGGAR
jgi:ABC-2 type transport system ATP-binding protein